MRPAPHADKAWKASLPADPNTSRPAGTAACRYALEKWRKSEARVAELSAMFLPRGFLLDHVSERGLISARHSQNRAGFSSRRHW
jgi:hypothetical protein